MRDLADLLRSAEAENDRLLKENTGMFERLEEKQGILAATRVELEQTKVLANDWHTAYDAAHSELVRVNNDLAACRELANGLRKQLEEVQADLSTYRRMFQP
jgi:chromosome segregation ATPase